MKLPADGFAILMHKDGTVIAYKDAAKAMKPASEIDNDLTNALIEQSKASNSLVPAFFDNEGRDKLLWATDIPDTDWELVLVLDKSTLEAPLSSLLMTQLGLAPAGAGGQHPRHLLAGQPAARPPHQGVPGPGPHRRR